MRLSDRCDHCRATFHSRSKCTALFGSAPGGYRKKSGAEATAGARQAVPRYPVRGARNPREPVDRTIPRIPEGETGKKPITPPSSAHPLRRGWFNKAYVIYFITDEALSHAIYQTSFVALLSEMEIRKPGEGMVLLFPEMGMKRITENFSAAFLKGTRTDSEPNTNWT